MWRVVKCNFLGIWYIVHCCVLLPQAQFLPCWYVSVFSRSPQCATSFSSSDTLYEGSPSNEASMSISVSPVLLLLGIFLLYLCSEHSLGFSLYLFPKHVHAICLIIEQVGWNGNSSDVYTRGPSSNVGLDINHPDWGFMVFLSLLRQIPGKYFVRGHNHLLPYPFRFIID